MDCKCIFLVLIFPSSCFYTSTPRLIIIERGKRVLLPKENPHIYGGRKMKPVTYGIMALFVLGLVAAGASAFGFGQNQDVQDALKNNDFAAWKSAHEAQLTEENFQRAVEMYHAHAQMQERMQAVEDAIKNDDYTAYQEAVSNMHLSISEDQFDKMVQQYQETGNVGPGLGKGAHRFGRDPGMMRGMWN